MPQIKLNIVGVFFDEFIDFGGGTETTVKDIMDEALMQYKEGSGKKVLFNYSAVVSEGVNIVNEIQANHTEDFTSRSGTPYQKGIYRLNQTFTLPKPDIYNVWQYYLFAADNKRIPVPGEQSYTVTKVNDTTNKVARIVWRLVSVCNKPTGVSRRMQKTIPQNMRVPEMF